MSLYRLVTRLAVVSALNNYMQRPFPTLVGPNVFDSKIEPVEDMAKDRAFPCCVVYTDYDKDHWTKGSKVHSDRLLSLTFELLIVQAKQVQGQNAYKLSTPYTDSEIESTLDVLETQIYRALTAGTEASDAFNFLCPSYTNVISRRGSSTEGGHRLAARQVTLEMKALREPASGTIPAPIGALLDRLEAFSDYADRMPDIRAMLEDPAAYTDFERVMRTLGYTRDLTMRLGGAPDGAAVLPPEISYHITGPQP